MADTQLCACEFVLIRLAPDPIRNEAVNIGVALYATAGAFAGVRINPDYSRVRKLSPLFDEAVLAGLEDDLLRHLQPEAGGGAASARERFFLLAQETFSQSLQLTPPAAVLTADPAAELDRLYRQYAAPLETREAALQAGHRRQILRHLQRVFAEERVLARLDRNVRAGDWLREPDAFRFDYHYLAAGLRHVIQAVPLAGEEAPIKALCFTVGRLRQALGGIEAAAFCQSAAAPPPGMQDFHRRLLADAGIRVLGLDAAPAEAARIRADLGLA